MRKPSEPTPTPPGASPRRVLPSGQNAQLALRESAVLMAPVVRWLLRHGVAYPAFADMLKRVFVTVAGQEIAQSGAKPTHSALSVLSGVHRKDVRSLVEAPQEPERSMRPPLSSQVFTRWIGDEAYRGPDGRPRPLPRTGPAPSFETLARAQSTDVHPRTVLEELIRLGLVTIDGETVIPRADAFVPASDTEHLAALFAARMADHVAAAVQNLTLDGPKFLEQSVFADGLSAESVERLAALGREHWTATFQAMVALAQARVENDRSDSTADRRMRFGVYFYTEPVASPADGDGSSATGAHGPESRGS